MMWASKSIHASTEVFYNPQKLRTLSKVLVDSLRDVLFADDCALCTTTQSDMQHAVDLFAKACKDFFGLTISLKKTKVMYQPPPGEPYVEPYIIIHGEKASCNCQISLSWYQTKLP